METTLCIMRLIKLDLSNFNLGDQALVCPYCDWQSQDTSTMIPICPKCESNLEVIDITDELLSLMKTNNGWRIIETAPRDATYIVIGWFEVKGIDVQANAMWNSRINSWCNTWNVFAGEPTHWRPRPLPPKPLYDI